MMKPGNDDTMLDDFGTKDAAEAALVMCRKLLVLTSQQRAYGAFVSRTPELKWGVYAGPH